MKFLPDGLKALAAFNQFVIYQVIPSVKRPGKTDKIPMDATGRYKIDHLDPQSWMSASDAISARNKLAGESYGVGFILTKDDPFFFIDIDGCIEPLNGTMSPIASSLIQAFHGAAIEVSSSGNGLHILGRGEVPVHGTRNRTFNMEFYTSARLVALTGTDLKGSVDLDCTCNLPWLVDNYFPKTKGGDTQKDWTETPCEGWNGPTDDTQLIERALRAPSARAAFGNHATFRDLWENNEPVLAIAYGGNQSSYDAALAQHLAFWTGRNCERMRQLMLRSQLIREKWERHDYLTTTILSACAYSTEVCQDKEIQAIETALPVQPSAPRATPVTGNTFLDTSHQAELFEGCVYVRDEHAILVPGGEMLRPDQFRAAYGGFTFQMDTRNERTTRNAWEAFTESQALRFPRATSTCFRPTHPPGDVIREGGQTLANLWWPIDTPRLHGDPEPFLTHLFKVLPDVRDATILLSYMAAVVQHKGIKFQWAPLIQGTEGNGKTLFTRCVAYAVGDRYTHIPNAKELAEKYNDWLYGRIFIGVEDVFVDAEFQIEVIEALKPMITSDRLEIRPMYGKRKMRDLCCNFIMNTNHKNGWRKTRNDRRIAPFYTAQQSAADLIKDGMTGDYFPNLYNWLHHKGGFAIVSELLHTYDIREDFNPANKRPAPETTSTEDAIAHGLGGIEQEIIEAVEQGVIGFKGGWISSIWVDRLLTRLHAGHRIPLNKRRDLLQSLGYDWHPGLPQGRVNNALIVDGGKCKLFIKKGHPAAQIVGAAEIAKAYTEAQT